MRASCRSVNPDEGPKASEPTMPPQIPSHPDEQPPSTIIGERSDSSEGKKEGTPSLEVLRQRMKDKIVHQQSQFKQHLTESHSANPDGKHPRLSSQEFLSHPSRPLRGPNSPHSIKSPGSTHKRGVSQDMDHSSFPFPSTAHLKASQDHVTRSREDSRRVNLRSTHGSLKKKMAKTPEVRGTQEKIHLGSLKHDFFPPGATSGPEDPSYPSPNLYDLALSLNADPGLDLWWSNVSRILKVHYGAERASLALPGDATDLENVPWGQKATYGIQHGHIESNLNLTRRESPETPDSRHEPRNPKPTKDLQVAENPTVSLLSKRPQLVARHSFAGHGMGRTDSGRREPDSRLSAPSKASSAAARRRSLSGASEKAAKIDNITPGAKVASSSIASFDLRSDFNLDTGPVAIVFQVPRSLEAEPNPLIKRTGIPKLFGRRKPTVLTREYADDPSAVYTPTSAHRHKDIVQPTLQEECPPKSSTPHNVALSQRSSQHWSKLPRAPLDVLGEDVEPESTLPQEAYEDYEQIPQSPWSQSPAPSPAPLSRPDENPFFTNPEVDEEAFASSPPLHDYSENQPLQAIGVDWSKTIIHIPLLYSPPSKTSEMTTLRFPVAIISLLAPVVPYPSNLRTSLAHLMPHLTTSFCLAQQYSQLEKQLHTSSFGRYGHLLGLGGTFSDEGSELELVAELSGQVNYPPGDESNSATRSSVSSPVAVSSVTRSNSALPGQGADHRSTGPRRDLFFSPAPLTHSVDTIDGYFRPKRPSQQSRSSRDSKTGEATSESSSPDLQEEKCFVYEELTPKDTSSLSDVSQVHGQPPASRHSSCTSIATQMQHIRPFSDTISQLILNSVPLHLFLAKPTTGEVIWTNTKFDTYRRQPHEPRVRDPFQNVHNSEYDNVIKEWTKALRTGSQFTERVRVRRLNDESTYRWFIFRANPLISSNGELLYWIGSFLDVHEQHMAELKAALERETFATDAKYRALANSIPQVVFEASEYRGLISANEQWELYTGQSLEEARNLGFAKHIHRDDLKKCGILTPPYVIPPTATTTEFGQIMADVLGPQSTITEEVPDLQIPTTFPTQTTSPTQSTSSDDGYRFKRGVTEALKELVRRDVVTIQRDENGRDSYTTEIRFRSRKGDFRWHLVRLVKVETTDFGNGEASWYGTCTDINDRKILERELNMAMQKLNREMESKTKFFTNMSHEIRTPLNGILGTIPFILDTQLDSDQRRMLDTIQNSSTNLRELVDNILDVSKVEAGKMNILRQWFHVRSALEDAIDTIASRAMDKGLELNYVFEPEVPEMVCGDRFRIRQILINLIGNSVKFTSQGEIFIRCSIHHDPEITLDPSETFLNFEVIDTGKGFSTRDAQLLMQRFSQIENNDAPQHAGSGLGLFLSKQIAEMHGGRLTPTSMEGRGAKFAFYVNVGVSPTKAQMASEPADSRPPTRAAAGAAGERQAALQNALPGQVPPVADISPDSATSGSFRSSHSATSSVGTGDPLAQARLARVESNLAKEHPAEVHSQAPAPGTMLRSKVLEAVAGSRHSETAVMSAITSHPTTYSVLIICPFDYTREAITQHIQQVIPLDVPANVTSILDLDDWKDLMNGNERPALTHVVLNLPDINDVKEIMNNVREANAPNPPTLVIVADAYLKRDITDFYEEYVSSGKQAVVLPKPLKPSTFSLIFDPHSKRDLSKDRNQAMARAMNDSFKTMSKLVKEMIGNKGHRVLLVEDDETNRAVMLKYLEKIRLLSETAGNGRECIDMVFSKEPGYYSLIICDIQMPVMNGYETCRAIRRWEAKNHFPQIPIMALSANAMTDQIDDAVRAGFNDYVTKPIKHNELGQMLMALLEPQATQIFLEGTRRR